MLFLLRPSEIYICRSMLKEEKNILPRNNTQGQVPFIQQVIIYGLWGGELLLSSGCCALIYHIDKSCMFMEL